MEDAPEEISLNEEEIFSNAEFSEENVNKVLGVLQSKYYVL